MSRSIVAITSDADWQDEYVEPHRGMRVDGIFTPPGLDKSLQFPGSLGGMNWGGLSFDPVHGYAFANDMRLGLWIQMIPSSNKGAAAGGGDFVSDVAVDLTVRVLANLLAIPHEERGRVLQWAKISDVENPDLEDADGTAPGTT